MAVLHDKVIGEANKYVMPAVQDYLAARCLLLNKIFVGLVIAHEAVEKQLKAILILEKVTMPQKCHDVSNLAALLIKKDSNKYYFLADQTDFLARLNLHYGWRYYDGDISKRSQSMSCEDLDPFDALWLALYECYTNFLPEEFRFRTYLLPYLFDENMLQFTNWDKWLLENNKVLVEKVEIWRVGYNKIFSNTV